MSRESTDNYLKVYAAARAAGIDTKTAKEVAERAFGVPDRCSYRGVEGDQCTHIDAPHAYHVWGSSFDGESVLTRKENT